MANTTFQSGTIVEAAWLNDVNDVVYDVLGDGSVVPTSKAGLRTALDVPQTDGTGATGTWPVDISGNAATATNATNASNATGPIASASTPGLLLVPRGYIAGLTMSTAGASTTMSVAAGQATDSTGVVLFNLSSSISKTTSAWAVGSGNGGLDTGTIANNTWYHFHVIRRPDTGVVDVLFSLSATSPTLPTNYTQFRRIGSGRTNGSAQWTRFFQTGDRFVWDNLGTLDFSGASSTTASLVTLTVPTGVKVLALLNVQDSNAGAGTAHYISDPDVSDVAASISAWPLGTIGAPINGGAGRNQVEVTTNTSAQVRQRNTRSDSTISIATIGWVDSRGKDA